MFLIKASIMRGRNGVLMVLAFLVLILAYSVLFSRVLGFLFPIAVNPGIPGGVFLLLPVFVNVFFVFIMRQLSLVAKGGLLLGLNLLAFFLALGIIYVYDRLSPSSLRGHKVDRVVEMADSSFCEEKLFHLVDSEEQLVVDLDGKRFSFARKDFYEAFNEQMQLRRDYALRKSPKQEEVGGKEIEDFENYIESIMDSLERWLQAGGGEKQIVFRGEGVVPELLEKSRYNKNKKLWLNVKYEVEDAVEDLISKCQGYVYCGRQLYAVKDLKMREWGAYVPPDNAWESSTLLCPDGSEVIRFDSGGIGMFTFP